ncbi:MAG: ribose 5-phosphate isomerase B [Rhodospirillaceae bacterium]
MSSEVVAIAADHAGFGLKQKLAGLITSRGFEVLDLGTHGPDSVDYPDFAEKVAEAILLGHAGRGVLVCGSGIGIGIAANRFPGIRAATCTDATMARLARAHNDANIISLGARIISFETASDCVLTFLSTPFDGGERHRRRIDKLG